MLRLETEFIVSDLVFSLWDDRALFGIASDTFQTKFVGQLNHWRMNDEGTLDELQSVALPTGGVMVRESRGPHSDALLYTAHTDPTLRLWTLNELRKPIKRYHFHDMSVEDLAVSPFDAEEFVSCSKDSTFAVWTATESEPVWAASNNASMPMVGVAYHPQNPSMLLAAPLDGKVEIYSREDRKRANTILPPDEMLFSCMDVSPYNEYLLAMADENGHVYLWDLRRLRRPIDHWQAHSLAVSQIRFNPHDDKLLGTGSTDCFFHLWHIEKEASMVAGSDIGSGAGSTSVHHAVGRDDIDPVGDDVQCLRSYKTHNLPITCWDWSVHELGLLADAGADYSIFLWNFVEEEEDSDERMQGVHHQELPGDHHTDGAGSG